MDTSQGGDLSALPTAEEQLELENKTSNPTSLIVLLVMTALITGGIAAFGVYWWQTRATERQELELRQIESDLRNLNLEQTSE